MRCLSASLANSLGSVKYMRQLDAYDTTLFGRVGGDYGALCPLSKL